MGIGELITEAWQKTSDHPIKRLKGALVLAFSIFVIGVAIVAVAFLFSHAPEDGLRKASRAQVIEYYPAQELDAPDE